MRTAEARREQYMTQLGRANRIRTARAEIKRQIRDGDLTVADVLINHMDTCSRMPLDELLRAQNRWGVGRSSRFLRQHGFRPDKQLESLTERQAGLIIEALG